MKLLIFRILFINCLMVHSLFVSVYAAENIGIDGDFSSRSLIMKSLNGEEKNRITQEQKDILASKNLTFDAKCLIEQIKKKNTQNVEILLNLKLNPNNACNSDYPIYIAAKTNNFEMVQLLYSRGAKLDKGFNSELYEAIKNKNEQMAVFLLDRGAKINYTDSVTGKTPLYLALQKNMTETAKMLLEKGARVNQKTYILLKKKKMEYLLEN